MDQTLGQAIRAFRQNYASRAATPSGRLKLSQDDLLDFCCEAEIAGRDGARNVHFRATHGRKLINEFETGRRCPSPEQLTILEVALRLPPGTLAAYRPKGDLQVDGRDADARPELGPATRGSAPPAPTDRPAAVDPRLGDWLYDLGDIEPTIEAGVRAQPGAERRFALPQEADTEDKDIKALRRALRDEPRLILLSGEAFLGKKTKIKGLLRLLAEQSDALVYDLPLVGGGVERLPIRAWSARRLHYRELVERVHDFLEDYRNARLGHDAMEGPGELRIPGEDRPLDALIESINVNFRDLPAVFIFTDVDAFGENHARNVVRDIGIEHLIRTLLDANRSSRIIITTTDFETAGSRNHQLVNFPNRHTIRVDPPAIAVVRHFLRRDVRAALTIDALYDHEATVRGDDLVSLAALINLTYRDQHAALPAQVVAALERLPAAAPEDRDVIRRDIYDQLVGAIAQGRLLHAITLIAASEDGVRLDSLRHLLAAWREHEPAIPEFASEDEIDAALLEFTASAGARFLRRTGIARYDPEEYDVDEVHGPRDRVWEMDPVVSMYFLGAVRKVDPQIAARAHRLIARIARKRSQQKKVAMRSPIGARASEGGSRDIQCYVNLLASILFEPGDDPTAEGPPLRLSESEIFALDHRFSPARALRFAVLCLLKEDIDHDYRLTMVFDEDALRLELYLLLFQDLGRVYTPEVEPLALPKALPHHLTCGIFTPQEVLDLMSTVALSAFHAQRFDVVDGVVDMAAEFASQHGVAHGSLSLSRLWCCRIDASIRRGRWTAGGGHEATRQAVAGYRKAWFPDLIDAAPGARIPSEDLHRQKSHLRLLVREAELLALSEPDQERAAAVYRMAERIEAAIWTTAEHHDPVVLSGRVARRYIQFLLQDASVVTPSPVTRIEENERLEKVRALLSINQSRLRRFSGADRVGVMLDMARLSMANRAYAKAHHYAESAKRRAFSGSVSHGGKLDVFQVLAKTKLQLVENRDAAPLPDGLDAGVLLREARTAIRNLRDVAKHLRYEPVLGMAYLLEARLFLALDDHRSRTSTSTSDRYPAEACKAVSRARAIFAAIGQVNYLGTLDRLEMIAEARVDQVHAGARPPEP